MGRESFPYQAGQGGDGARQNHVGRGRKPHPLAPPRPAPLPSLVPSLLLLTKPRVSLKEKDERQIRNRFLFPPSVKVRIPDGDDRVVIQKLTKSISTKLTLPAVFVSPSSFH